MVPTTSAPCPAECKKGNCANGNLTNGGQWLTSGRCVHHCSRPFASMRHCGDGALYEGSGAVDCSACARPTICDGLPCWSSAPPRLPDQGFMGKDIRHIDL